MTTTSSRPWSHRVLQRHLLDHDRDEPLQQWSDFSEGSSGQIDDPIPKPPGRSAIGDADNDTSRPCIPVYASSGFVSVGPADSDDCPKRDIPHSCLKRFRIEWVTHRDMAV